MLQSLRRIFAAITNYTVCLILAVHGRGVYLALMHLCDFNEIAERSRFARIQHVLGKWTTDTVRVANLLVLSMVTTTAKGVILFLLI